MANAVNDQPTTQDILEAINTFASSVEGRFEKIDGRFDGIDGRFDHVEGRLDHVEGKLDNVEGRLNRIEATMVTKDYLDDKLADMRGDLVVLMRKEDRKLVTLIDVLKKKQLLSDEETRRILTMEPFPQT